MRTVSALSFERGESRELPTPSLWRDIDKYVARPQIIHKLNLQVYDTFDLN